MLELIPNEKKSAIQMLFSDYFTNKQQFVTAFALEDAKEIGKQMIKLVKELEKEKGKV